MKRIKRVVARSALAGLSVVALCLAILVPIEAAAAASTVFTPEADSYVDGSHATRNYGTRPFARTDASPERTTFLKFNVTGAGQPGSALLRVFAESGNSGLEIRSVTDNAWGEQSITYNNAPSYGAVLATSGTGGSGWYNVDVSALVAGDGVHTLAITTSNTTATKLSSREGANPPQLLVPAPASPSPFLVTGSGSSYTATSQNPESSATFSGTLKFVVEAAAQDLEAYGGGTITFGAGTFDLGSDHFEFGEVDSLTFEGQGIDNTTIINNSADLDDTEIFDMVHADNIVIRDMTLFAGGPLRATSDAIDFDDGNNSTVERVKITGSRGRGIVFDGKGVGWSATGNQVVSCIIQDVPGDGIEFLGASGNSVVGCQVSNVGGHGIQVTKSSSIAAVPNLQSNNNIVSGNTVDNAGLDGINLNSSNDNQFTNNTVTNSADDVGNRDGIRILSTNGISCNDNIVEGNTATDNQGTKTQRYGLNISSAECNRTAVGVNNFAGNLVADINDLGTDTQYNTPPDTEPPTVPTGVAAVAPSGIQVDLNWNASTDNIGVTEYGIYRDGALIASAPGGAQSYSDTTVLSNTTYLYSIDAADAAGNRSAQSSPPVSVTTPNPPSSLTYAPQADAYVHATNAGTNYGNSSSIQIDGSPDKRGYMRFGITGLTGTVTSATLRVYANSSHSSGYEVHGVADNTWGEQLITYSNAPAVGSLLAGSNPTTAGTYSDIDVTNYVTSNGSVSFALTPITNTNLSLASRESSNPPQLILEQDTTGNTPPAADDLGLVTDEDLSGNWIPAVSDPDPDSLICTITSQPANGSAAVNSDCSTGSYTPNPDFNGADSFVYQVTDGSFTDTGSVSVTINPINDVPVADAQSVTLMQDTSVTVNLSGSDIDGDCPLAFAIDTPPTNGSLGTIGNELCNAGAGSAEVLYTPNTGFVGSDSYTITVTDPFTGTSAPATVSITVDPTQTNFTFSAVADAYVSGSATGANFGTSSQLRVDGSPDLRSYMRFDVAGLSGSVASATLRVYAGSTHSTGFQLNGVTDNLWDELGINYTIAPAFGPVLGASGPTTGGSYVEIDVASYVLDNGSFSFALTPLSNTNLRLGSREGGSPPQLVIVLAP